MLVSRDNGFWLFDTLIIHSSPIMHTFISSRSFKGINLSNYMSDVADPGADLLMPVQVQCLISLL